jgi:glycerol uptake facilitator-like aquaporin
MIVSGALSWVRGALLISAQIAGGIIAAGLNTRMLPGPVAVITTLSARTSVRQGLSIEAFLTSLLVFVILMLAAEKHAHNPTGSGRHRPCIIRCRACRSVTNFQFYLLQLTIFCRRVFHRWISQPSQKLWAIGGHK